MKLEKVNSLIYKICTLILIIGSVYFFSKTSYCYYKLITSPYQQEYREAVTSLATQLLVDNENPYRIENQPEYGQAYGIVQNLIAYPFAYLLGSSLQTHRLVTLVGIILSCLVIILWLSELKISLLIAVPATLTLYLSFFYNVLPLNRPDSWGLFFMLLSLYIPFKYNYSTKSLIASIGLGLIAFYTKSYFVLGIISIGSFLFFFISKKKGLIYTLFFLITFAVSIYVVSSVYPLFFYLTVLSFLNYAIGGSWMYANEQVITFLYINKFFLLLGIISISSFVYFKTRSRKTLNYKINLNMVNFDKGLITTTISLSNLLVVYTFFLFFGIVYIVLGRNGGAFLVYYFTHITPILILVVIIFLFKSANKALLAVGMLLIVLNIWSVDRLLYSSDLTEEEQKNWQKAKTYIENSYHVIGSPVVANLIKEKGLKVYKQGLSGQFISAGNVKKPILKSIFPRYIEIDTVLKQFYAQIDNGLINQKFDLVITEKGNSVTPTNKPITKNYDRVDVLTLAMPFSAQYWELEFWKPKKSENTNLKITY